MAEPWLNIKIAFYGIIAIKGDVNSRLLVLFINMEILSLSFAFFVFKLAICTVPIVLGIYLFLIPQEKKTETRQKLSSKLLGDSNLLTQKVYNFGLYFIACLSMLSGLIIALILFL